MSPCISASDRRLAGLIASAILALAPAALAQVQAQAQVQPLSETPSATAVPCAATDAALPPALASWTAKVDLVSAASAADLPQARIALGQAARVTLHGTRDVAYAVQPEKPGGSVAHGGLLTFTIAEAGSYRVGLSSGAWIDVLKDGQAQVSTAHGHGPACSTLRKMVDFNLRPGVYELQISANADPEIGVLVVKAP
jgi:hypothetical protein